MNNPTSKLCYLCGEPLEVQAMDQDHVFQKQFIKREQPKTPGYFYAGCLPVHKTCNNHFGKSGSKAESICHKALLLLNVLHDDKTLWRTHKDNPNINIIAIRSDLLPGFTGEDIKFFKLISLLKVDYDKWSSPSFFDKKEKVSPFEKPINTALTVLAKSSAAFLVKYENILPVSKWRILAVPYYASDLSLDEILGHVKPIEIGFKFWVKKFPNGDKFTTYAIDNLCIFFCFALTQDLSNFKIINERLSDDNAYYFESNKLIDLVGYNWGNNNFDKINNRALF